MIKTTLTGKSILITGGTGSFGTKFAEILLKEYQPRKLIIFSRDEMKQHAMRQKFRDGENSPVRYFIGDVRDRDRLFRAFHGVDIVVHTAALKQVPACEYNPFEAVLTNIMGAKNVIDAAIDCRVKQVLAISTDKAVNPINLYGATKLCAEKLFIDGNVYAGGLETRFSCARYGNVVGSRGSVIPIFIQQRKSGTLTVTDPRMTRFWITLEQGARFVIQSLEEMYMGEIFVPKIPSMNIMNLCKAIAPECETNVIGIRPGEKIHELLISAEEAQFTRELEDRFVILPLGMEKTLARWSHAKPLPEGFRYSSDENPHQLMPEALRRLVDTIT